MSWAFRIFDCDNSKSIAVEEFGASVKEVWKIFDGIGETEYNPGDPDKIASDLVTTLKKNNLTEIGEADFVRISTIDKSMGNHVVNIYRSFIGKTYHLKGFIILRGVKTYVRVCRAKVIVYFWLLQFWLVNFSYFINI